MPRGVSERFRADHAGRCCCIARTPSCAFIVASRSPQPAKHPRSPRPVCRRHRASRDAISQGPCTVLATGDAFSGGPIPVVPPDLAGRKEPDRAAARAKNLTVSSPSLRFCRTGSTPMARKLGSRSTFRGRRSSAYDPLTEIPRVLGNTASAHCRRARRKSSRSLRARRAVQMAHRLLRSMTKSSVSDLVRLLARYIISRVAVPSLPCRSQRVLRADFFRSRSPCTSSLAIRSSVLWPPSLAGRSRALPGPHPRLSPLHARCRARAPRATPAPLPT